MQKEYNALTKATNQINAILEACDGKDETFKSLNEIIAGLQSVKRRAQIENPLTAHSITETEMLETLPKTRSEIFAEFYPTIFDGDKEL